MGSRAAADEDRKPVDRERLLLPCLPPPAVRVTVTCNNKKNAQKAVGFRFFFPDLFKDLCSLLSWFVFFFCRWLIWSRLSSVTVGAAVER
jgi:hypothetical protein